MVAATRDDIVVIDGGMLVVPDPVDFQFNFGFQSGKIYATTAKIITLALEGWNEDCILGKDTTRRRMDEMVIHAAMRDFRLSGMCTFKCMATGQQIDTLRRRTHQLRRRNS
jgi:predicted amino acid dehydrogenase